MHRGRQPCSQVPILNPPNILLYAYTPAYPNTLIYEYDPNLNIQDFIILTSRLYHYLLYFNLLLLVQGVQPLLDGVISYLPCPIEVNNYALDQAKNEDKVPDSYKVDPSCFTSMLLL